MFNSLSLEEQSYYLARIIYRETKIEEYHTDKAVMDMKLYDDMYAEIDKNVRTVRRVHHILLNIQTKQDFEAELHMMSDSEQSDLYVIV